MIMNGERIAAGRERMDQVVLLFVAKTASGS
jgi:hypothetical protein